MPASLRVLVSGAGGRMGRALASLAADDPEFELIGGIGRDAGDSREAAGYPEIVAVSNAAELIGRADVVIDFSAPAFLRSLLENHEEAFGSRGLVVGTTGLGDQEERLLAERAKLGPVVTAANFSVGVNVLLTLVRQVSTALSEFDVEIVEAHHRRKEDAPSGTALALGNAVAAGRGVELESVRRDGRSGRPGPRPEGEIGFHALRGGDVIGDHQVLFYGEMERIEIAHRASDRAVFAAGALRAARWVAGRPAGGYSMADVLGFS
jgi:4-hydroxy-tetrahydrodipicolinate reductase